MVDSTADAVKVFQLCREGELGRVRRRLHDHERKMIRNGSVFVFSEQESGVRRWTDGRLWSPSRIYGDFLIYRELEKKYSKKQSLPLSSSREDTDTLKYGSSYQLISSSSSSSYGHKVHPVPDWLEARAMLLDSKFRSSFYPSSSPIARGLSTSVSSSLPSPMSSLSCTNKKRSKSTDSSPCTGSSDGQPISSSMGSSTCRSSENQIFANTSGSSIGDATGTCNSLICPNIHSAHDNMCSLSNEPVSSCNGFISSYNPVEKDCCSCRFSSAYTSPYASQCSSSACPFSFLCSGGRGGISVEDERQVIIRQNGKIANNNHGSVSFPRSLYIVKEDGLIKKTMSMNIDGQLHHLICYYSKIDFMLGKESQAFSQMNTGPSSLLTTNINSRENNGSSLPFSTHLPAGSSAGDGAKDRDNLTHQNASSAWPTAAPVASSSSRKPALTRKEHPSSSFCSGKRRHLSSLLSATTAINATARSPFYEGLQPVLMAYGQHPALSTSPYSNPPYVEYGLPSSSHSYPNSYPHFNNGVLVSASANGANNANTGMINSSPNAPIAHHPVAPSTPSGCSSMPPSMSSGMVHQVAVWPYTPQMVPQMAMYPPVPLAIVSQPWMQENVQEDGYSSSNKDANSNDSPDGAQHRNTAQYEYPGGPKDGIRSNGRACSVPCMMVVDSVPYGKSGGSLVEHPAAHYHDDTYPPPLEARRHPVSSVYTKSWTKCKNKYMYEYINLVLDTYALANLCCVLLGCGDSGKDE